MPVGQFILHMLNQSDAINSLLGRRSLRLQLTSSGCGSARPRWCRRRAPLPLGSIARPSISPSRAARRQARASAPHGAVCLSLSQYFSFFIFFFSFFLYAKQSLGLRSNTKARNVAVHYRLFAAGTEKRRGVTENYKALPLKYIFRTFDVVRRYTSK